MTSVSCGRAGARLSTMERTSASAETQMTTASSPAANSASDGGAWQPSSAASSAALTLVRFQTDWSNPARWRFLAMGAPMAPRPAKPTRVIGANYQVQGPQRKSTPEGGDRGRSREWSALRAADGFDCLGGIDAFLAEFGVVQVFKLSIFGGAIEALRIDGLRICVARLLAA